MIWELWGTEPRTRTDGAVRYLNLVYFPQDEKAPKLRADLQQEGGVLLMDVEAADYEDFRHHMFEYTGPMDTYWDGITG